MTQIGKTMWLYIRYTYVYIVFFSFTLLPLHDVSVISLSAYDEKTVMGE